MLSANVFRGDRFDFAGFGESIVTRVEVLTLFRVFEFGGELSVETEESLLFWGEGLRVFVRNHKSWEAGAQCTDVTKLLTLISTLFI